MNTRLIHRRSVKVERDPALSPRDSRDMTGNPVEDATPALPPNLTDVPPKLAGKRKESAVKYIQSDTPSISHIDLSPIH